MNRHICSSCRLSKCFKNGMKIELIRSSIGKKGMNQKKNCETKILVRLIYFP